MKEIKRELMEHLSLLLMGERDMASSRNDDYEDFILSMNDEELKEHLKKLLDE